MTSPYLLAGDGSVSTLSALPTRPQIPTLVLESMDGTERIRLDGTEGWIRMPGSTGLEMPPFEAVSQAIPGMAGSSLSDVRVLERPIFIPIYVGADGDMLRFREMLRQIHRFVDPFGRRTFRLVGESASGSREMIVRYSSGLEGADAAAESGLSWAKFGLNLVAHGAFARAREDRVLEFRHAATFEPFLGVVGGTDTPWPRSIVSTSVIGEGMVVNIGSEQPVYPVVDLVGPMTSFRGDLSPTAQSDGGADWSIDVPLGVPAGSTLRLVTSPDAKSIRMDGQLAAGKVARGSSLRPFYPGQNMLNVAAPGSTEETVIRLSWRELYRSLW